jgi:MYXO-CTERM domain-containing protein
MLEMSALRNWVVLVLAAALAVPSCGTESKPTKERISNRLLPDSAGAERRVAELRARFRWTAGPLDERRRDRRATMARERPVVAAGVAEAFETWANEDGGTHLLVRLPAKVLRGVRHPARVSLPRYAGGVVKLEDQTSRVAVHFAVQHVQNTPVETASGIALYRGALEGADVLHRVRAEGTEDFVVFETPPAREEISYDVDVSRVAGVRLVANTLEFLDDTGAPRLRVAPPYVVDHTGASSSARLAVAGCAYDASPVSPFRRGLTAPGSARCTVSITWSGVAYPAIVDPAWTTTGSLARGRDLPTASVLSSGDVLIAGGIDISVHPWSISSAELFHPGTGVFAATGSLVTGRAYHSAVVLKSGKPLLVGGDADIPYPGYVYSAELYDPALGTFSETGSMASPRDYMTATILPSGKVLVAGGFLTRGEANSTAELYDPISGTFSPTGSLAVKRGGYSATVLTSGKVLLAGGSSQYSGIAQYLSSAELYDPISGTFSATGAMGGTRGFHTASLLSSGKVLLTGGNDVTLVGVTKSAEVYDPASGKFSPTGSMSDERTGHTATVLPSDEVLIVAGYSSLDYLATVELYDPKAGAFSPLAPLTTARYEHTASTLLSGRILIAAGDGNPDPPLDAEILAGTIGDPCEKDTYCLSGICVDGVCCDTRCDKSCDRCDLAGKKGTCSIVGKGALSDDPACAYACDGLGPACPTSCASDGACAPLYYCGADGTCKPRKAQGSGCAPGADCKEPGCRECAGQDANAAGYCVDGVCCDGPCAQGCEACAASLKQSGRDDGVCGPTKDGTDPRNACAPSALLCHEDGQCNGTGACRLTTPAGVACDVGKVCDGSGSCVRAPVDTCDGDHTVTHADGTVADCSPFRCNSNGTCRTTCTSVADCVAPTICDVRATCTSPPSPPGDPVANGCGAAPAQAGDPGHRPVAFLALALALLCARRRSSNVVRRKPTFTCVPR